MYAKYSTSYHSEFMFKVNVCDHLLCQKGRIACRQVIMTLQVLFFMRQSLMYPGLASNSLCSQHWSWTLDHPVSIPLVLELQVFPVKSSLYDSRIEPQASIRLGKHYTNWTASQISSYPFKKSIFKPYFKFDKVFINIEKQKKSLSSCYYLSLQWDGP